MSKILSCLPFLFAAAGTIQYFRVVGWKFHAFFVILQFFPVTVFGLTEIIYRQTKSILLLLLAIPFCALTIYVWIMGNLLLDPTAHSQLEYACDETKYNHIMKLVYGNNNGNYDRFPATFPPDATDARIYYDQHPTRGGITLQFQYNTSSEEIQRLSDYYGKSSYKREDPGKYRYGYDFYTLRGEEEPASYHFKDYYFTDNPSSDSDSGVSLDKAKNIVVYWMRSP